MQLRRVLTSLVVASIVAAPAIGVAGKGPKIMVVPLGGSVTGESPSLPARLSETLRKTVEDSGARVTMSRTSVDDLMLLHGCSMEDHDCLRKMARSLDVDELVVGYVGPGDREYRVVVELLRVRPKGDPEALTFRLTETGLDAQLTEMGELAGEFYPKPKTEPEKAETEEKEPQLDPTPPGPPPSPSDDSSFSLRNVKMYSWVLAGVGVAVAGTGLVFWGSASGLQSDIDAMDPFALGTVGELDALRDLEDRAQTRFRVGNGMVIAGGLLVAAGATLIILQARDSKSEPGGVAVTPTLIGDGAGVAITVVSP